MKEPYDGKNQGLTSSELHCKKIKWMVDHSPEWDYENTSLEDYLETVPDYPPDERWKATTICTWGLLQSLRRKRL